MSGYLNKATLIGNLGDDPEVRVMQNGGRVVTLSIATSESWKDDRSGERRERVEWHRVVIFTCYREFKSIGGDYVRRGSSSPGYSAPCLEHRQCIVPGLGSPRAAQRSRPARHGVPCQP